MGGSGRHGTRREARRALLQALYEVDCSGHSLDSTLQWVLEQTQLSPVSRIFIQDLAAQVVAHSQELDKEIRRYAPAWPVEQLPAVDRNILRIAIYELKFARDTPPKIAINEAVELAKRFGGEGSQRFVNGVLGAVMRDLLDEVVSN